MNLTVLVDNNTYIDQYYLGEPALSFYIELGNKKILFDTGYSDILLSNAEKMGINLHGLTHIVFSHGHNDHTRGLQFLEEKVGVANVEIIAHKDCFLPKCYEEESIGAPYSDEVISKMTKYHPCKIPFWISEDMVYLGEIPRVTTFEAKTSIGKLFRSGNWEDDYLLDDTALVYKHTEGLFIITGCSHSGICNIVEYAKKVCKEERIFGIIGGFHLSKDNEQLAKTIEYLASCKVKQLYPCHCVSLAAKVKMMEKLPVREVGVGMSLSLEEEKKFVYREEEIPDCACIYG